MKVGAEVSQKGEGTMKEDASISGRRCWNRAANNVPFFILLAVSLLAACGERNDVEGTTNDEQEEPPAVPNSAGNTDFFMAILSDPQFYWTNCKDGSGPLCDAENAAYPGYSSESLSRLYNYRIVKVLNDAKIFLGDYPIQAHLEGAIINGDLTEFGDKDGSRAEFQNYYLNQLKMTVFPGLGNHDYQNNVDDCFNNDCVFDMLWNFRNWIQTLQKLLPVTFDYTEWIDRTGFFDPCDYYNYQGSLSYSWDIRNIHFVQLNNHPKYARTIRRPYYYCDNFYIYPSVEWLKSDLKAARDAGKHIILNVHDGYEFYKDTELQNILDDYNVSAVFSGHYHDEFRRYAVVGNTHVPVFMSGAAHCGTFFLVWFQNSVLMSVYKIKLDPFDGGKIMVDCGDTYTESWESQENWHFLFNGRCTKYMYQMK